MKKTNLSLDKIEEIQLNILKENLKFIVKNSKYYKNKFKEHGINVKDVKSLDDFEKLPFTYPEELKKNPYNFLTIPFENINFICCSSATTSTPKIFFQKLPEHLSKTYNKILKTKKNDKVAIINLLCSPSSFLAQYNFSKIEITPVVISIETPPLTILKMLKKLKITVIRTQPSYMLYITKAAEEANINLKKGYNIRTIILAGSHLTKNLRRYIESKWNAEVYDRYSCLEFSNVANECKAHDGLHILTDRILIEVINRKTKGHVKEGEIGELVLTSLKKYPMPLIRYQTIDLAKYTTKKCECGSNVPRIWVIGRRNELIKFGKKGNFLSSAVIYKILEKFKEITGYFKLIISSNDKNEILNFKVETIKNEYVTNKNLKKLIQKELINFFKKSRKYTSKYPLKLKVKLVPPNKILKISYTNLGKPKNVIKDKRSKNR